ncbi:MAG TPA: hypothetical protein VNA57_11600 [Acidimicrobiales bacterium]|nr:hypothetical protein [Acidimicrobiales bacterium]
MSQTATKDPQDLVGEPALDENGAQIGEIRGIYLQNGTRQPEWAAIEVTDGELTLAPLVGATPTEDGVWLPVDVDEVLGAPARHSDLPRHVTDDEAAALYRHYGSGRSRARNRAANGAGESSRSRGRRRATGDSPSPREAAGVAADEGTRVASAAADQGSRVASTAAEEGKRVASTAVQQGQEVARTAAGQATELAGTAREQATQVSEELTNQARTLIQGTRSEIQGQVQTQTQILSDSLRRLGDEARALAEGRPDQAGALAQYVSQAAERLTNVAKEIEARGPEGLVEDLRSFAKARPGTFVLGAAVAGFGIGRLIRSAGDGGQAEVDADGDITPSRTAVGAGNGRGR